MTFSGLPSFADRSYTRSVPYWPFATVYARSTLNVPQQPVPQVAITWRSTRTAPFASSSRTRNVASNTLATPLTRPGWPSAAPHAGRSMKIAGSWSV